MWILVFIHYFWEIIDFMQTFHYGGVAFRFDLLVGWVFRMLVSAGNAVATSLLNAS